MLVSADGRGVVSHVGTRLLADVAAAAGLPDGFDAAVGVHRRRRSAHATGRVLTDLAVLLADGGEATSDLAVLRDQPGLFGCVASTATAWRVLDGVDAAGLDALKQARAEAIGVNHDVRRLRGRLDSTLCGSAISLGHCSACHDGARVNIPLSRRKSNQLQKAEAFDVVDP